jgi:hypothetical protein
MADMTRVFVPRPDKFKRLSYDKSQLKQFNVFKTISMDLNNKKRRNQCEASPQFASSQF